MVSAVADGEQDVSMPAATALNDGYMPKEAFEQLESLVSNPSGISAVIAGDAIVVNTTTAPGSAATPEISVAENSFIPYNLNNLNDL